MNLGISTELSGKPIILDRDSLQKVRGQSVKIYFGHKFTVTPKDNAYWDFDHNFQLCLVPKNMILPVVRMRYP